MNINFLKALINEIDNSNIDFFCYKSNEISLTITKKANIIIKNSGEVIDNNLVSVENQARNEIAASKQSEVFKEIKSQFVGIVKLNHYKTLRPFVKMGQSIDKGDILCVIESLNIPIVVKSDVSGVISSINVKESEIVDYGKVLFIINVD
jgi:acetyl-CoA carboxylase biotin carboxyl carrier protein